MASTSYNWPVNSSTVTATSPSTGTTGITAPTQATEVGFIDGSGNLQPLTGTVLGGPIVTVAGSALPTGGATAALQTTGNSSLATIATNTGAATPAGSNIIGKVGIDQTTPGTTNLVALAANQSVNVAQMNGVTTTMGNGVAGTGVQRVAVASDNTPFPVKIDQTTPGTTNLVALAANQSVNVAQMNGVATTMGNGVAGTGVQRVAIASDNTPYPIKVDQTTPGTTNAVSLAQVGATTVATGNGVVSAGVQRVAIASDNTAFSVNAVQSGTWTVQPGNTANTTAWLVSQVSAATAALTSVASSATTVSLLASNASRKNATFFNDSTAVLYLKFGTTASTTSYTVQIAALGYYELPDGKIYTGAIDGIWASANGNARITELT